MLPVAVLTRPMAHGATMPALVPKLLMMPIVAARDCCGRCAVGIAQKIGNAEYSPAAATDNSASEVARLEGWVVSAARAIAAPVTHSAK